MFQSLLKRWRNLARGGDTRRAPHTRDQLLELLDVAEGQGATAAAARRRLSTALGAGAVEGLGAVHIALYHPHESERCAAVARIDDEDELRRLIGCERCEKTQLAAIERSCDATRLRSDLRQLREHDKNLAHALQQRIRELAQTARDERSQRQQLDKLVADFEGLARVPWDKYYGNRLLHLQRQRRRLDGIDEASRRRIDAAELSCKACLEDHRQRLELPALQRRGTRALGKILRQLRREAEALACVDLRRMLDEERGDWEESQERVPADESLRRERDEYIAALNGYLRAGEIWEARRDELRKLMTDSDGADDAEQLRGRLRELRRLSEEIDWPSGFAKPEALRALPTTMRELARRIARRERSDDKQRLRAANPTDAERNQQKRRRDLQRLSELLDALENALAELDEHRPDWKSIDAFKRKIIAARRKELPKNAAAATDRRYRAALDVLNERLGPLYEQHAERKRVLINMARKLAEVDDAARAGEQARQLREAWNELSAGPEEVRLGREFNSTLDDVFADRRDLSKRRRQKRDFDRKIIDRNIAAIDALRDVDDSELGEAQPRYRQLHEETMERLDGVPEKAAETLRARLLKAGSRFEAHCDSLQQRQHQRDLELARQCATLCRNLELAGDDERDAAAQSLQERWQAPMAAALAKRLETRRQAAIAARCAGKTKQRRLLAIRLELLAELDSPDEEAELRSDYQMERLERGFGGSADDIEAQRAAAADMELAWLCGPVAKPELERRLAPRIDRALATLHDKLKPKPKPKPQSKSRSKSNPRGAAKTRHPKTREATRGKRSPASKARTSKAKTSKSGSSKPRS